MHPFITQLIVAGFIFACSNILAADIHIAVASNFTIPLKVISQKFTKSTGHKVLIISGATGKHYAQIRNGAPFDLFFAADKKRPELLEKQGLIQKNSRFTYAIGKLVLWSPQTQLIKKSAQVLYNGQFQYLAIANPKLAPYGKAAQQVLQKKGLWQALRPRMVRGENIGQTFQFVKSGNAQLGFVALSQIQNPQQIVRGSIWKIADSLYDPIEQQAVLLTDNKAAQTFAAYIQQADIQQLIHLYGYGTQ